MQTVRIKGLVAVATSVREKLSRGLLMSEVDAFRRDVATNTATVEQICRDHHIQLVQLLRPTYQAYTFLKALDLNRLPMRDPTADPPAPTVRLKNITQSVNAIHAELDRISQEPLPSVPYAAHPPVARVLLSIARNADDVEASCRKSGTDPSKMPAKSRQHFQWLRYLSDPDNMNAHMATLAAFRAILAEPSWAGHPLLASRPIDIELYVIPQAYQIHTNPKLITIVLSEGYVNAPREVIEAILQLVIVPEQKQAKALLKAYIMGDDFIETLSAVELLAAPIEESVRGRHYDLAEVFARVNAAYFGGAMPRPRLTWNKTLTVRKMGHYRFGADTVMISTTLDDPHVPAYVIDMVMHHELLHKQMGIQVINGRRYAHTDAFRKAERRFEQYETAKRFMETMH